MPFEKVDFGIKLFHFVCISIMSSKLYQKLMFINFLNIICLHPYLPFGKSEIPIIMRTMVITVTAYLKGTEF